MNVYDSARMADSLAPLGFEETDVPEGADLVIINTSPVALPRRRVPSCWRGHLSSISWSGRRAIIAWLNSSQSRMRVRAG
jgi:hypothetical protein